VVSAQRGRVEPRPITWRTHWVVLVLCAMLVSACGPHAAAVGLAAAGTTAAGQTRTPVAWRVELTPTPGPPTAMPRLVMAEATGPAPLTPPPLARSGAAQAQAADPLATVPPTIGPIRASVPTPTLEPPVQCQFGSGALSALAAYAAGSVTTPGVVPTYYQGVPGLTTVAVGEPLPDVLLELRLSRTSFVAGAVIQVETRVRNTSAQAVSVSPAVSTVTDGDTEPAASAQTDPRSFPTLFGGLGSGGPIVPGGQTWSIPSVVQLPFDTAERVHLHASVGLAAIASPTQTLSGPRLTADIPLQLTVSTPAQQLHLEARMDHRQWCLLAADARGATPAGSLRARMTARGPSTFVEGAGSPGATNMWAGRWDQNEFPGSAPITASFWVGGADYVTAVAQQTLAAGP
jgi:hypothetical protein